MALVFTCAVVALFVLVLLWEEQPGAQPLRPAGLLRWLTAGNWTAKLGALLLSIGSGALLRYLMLNLTFPPSAKILAGVLLAAVFGVAGALLAAQPRRRAISLALTGAALAVAYLTAYSAYGFFHFVADPQALGLLFMVASVATAIAVVRRAVSIAVLAMAGAYLAPAFALHGTDPVPVYGYYAVVSLVTALMVWLRGWRPLIHLSFLFTLAGALFFAWTQKFYTPDHYAQMQPLLLALVGIHLAMPLLEGRRPAGAPGAAWAQGFDQVYFLLLPLVGTVLTLVLAPRLAQEGALGLLALSALWLVAAGWVQLAYAAGAVRYAAVAVALAATAGLLAVPDIPVFLVAAVLLCALITAAPRLQLSRGAELMAIAAAWITSACYVLQSLFAGGSGTALVNVPFAEHLLLGVALVITAWSLHRREHTLAPVFAIYGGTWLLLSVAAELLRLHYAYLPQLLYVLALAITAASGIVCLARARAPHRVTLALCGAGLLAAGFASAPGFAHGYLLALMIGGQLAWSVLALACDRDAAQDEEDRTLGAIARSALPVLLLPWALAWADHWSDAVLTLLLGSALLASVQAQWLAPRTGAWPNWLSPAGFVIFGTFVLYESLFHIERRGWDVAFELLALVYLGETARYLSASGSRDSRLFGYLSIAAVASVSTAMVLRLIGPPGTLTILDLNRMVLPAFVSLLWAAIGGVLTWLATRQRSRVLWSLGALLLVAAAVKLVLFDFGSLGQIGNIVAMMAAGGVFLLVAWVAPFPPKAEPERAQRATLAAPEAGDDHGWLWFSAIVLLLLLHAFRDGWQPQRPAPVVMPLAHPTVVEVTRQAPLPAPRLAGAQPDTACRRFAEALPPDYLVYAAGDGDEPAPVVTVRVNGIGEPLVLALGSAGPTTWRLSRADAANVVGVILSGAHRSVIVGLPANVPVLHAAVDDHAPCGAFVIDTATPQGANQFVSRLLVHAVDGYVSPTGRVLFIGTPPAVSVASRELWVQVGSATYASARNGRSLDVTAVVRSRCEAGAGTCAFHCGNELAGDPDFGQPKLCTVQFSCAGGPARTARLQEGQNIRLSCE